MKIFISVSGCLSSCVGRELYDTLNYCFQGTEPWLAEEDINKGEQWRAKLSQQLSVHAAGIIVLTRSNQQSPWVCFEAGAIAALSEFRNVFVLCVDFPKSDVAQGPLSGFQNTDMDPEDLAKLASALNKVMPTPLDHKAMANVSRNFVESVVNAVSKCKAECDKKEEAKAPPNRKSEDILRELLDLTRENARQLSELSAKGFPPAGGFGIQGVSTGPTGPTGVVFGPQSGVFYPTASGAPPISVAGGSTRHYSKVKWDPNASANVEGEAGSSTSARVE